MDVGFCVERCHEARQFRRGKPPVTLRFGVLGDASYRIRGQMMDAVEKELRMAQRRGPMQDEGLIPDKRAAADTVLVQLEVASLLGCLSPRNASIMSMIYLDGLTLRETAEVVGVTEARICQIRKAAISKLRSVYHQEVAA